MCVLAGKPGGGREDGNLNELKWACAPARLLLADGVVLVVWEWALELLLATRLPGNGRNGRRGEEIS